MKINRLFIPLVAALAVLTVLACDAGNLVALGNATVTPTRTPRPTFTPRPSFSPTPEDSPTPEVTDTPEPSPTTAQRATATTAAKPAATRTPTKPAAPTVPAFLFRALTSDGSHGKCSTGAPVYEIKGRIAGSDYLAGIHVVLLDKDNKIVSQVDSWGREKMNLEWGVSCFEEKNLFNYQLDATTGWFNGPLILRLTKSANDLSPLSPNVPITFDATGGRYYIDFVQ